MELLRIHIKPLPKKAGDRDIRPICLVETTVKLKDVSPEIEALGKHTHASPPRAIWIPYRSLSWRQMTGLLHDVRQTKRVAVLNSVDLKGAYDRVSSEKLLLFLNSKGLPPEWMPYLSHVIVNRHL